jgi:hypothetical protein
MLFALAGGIARGVMAAMAVHMGMQFFVEAVTPAMMAVFVMMMMSRVARRALFRRLPVLQRPLFNRKVAADLGFVFAHDGPFQKRGRIFGRVAGRKTGSPLFLATLLGRILNIIM